MLTAACHCGAVRIEIPRKPRRLTSCNCSICRRHGTQWAYFRHSQVKITAAHGKTHAYCWGDKTLKFVRCGNCGCVTHWQSTRPTKNSRIGVNMNNFDPGLLASVRIRRLDGASTWKFLD